MSKKLEQQNNRNEEAASRKGLEAAIAEKKSQINRQLLELRLLLQSLYTLKGDERSFIENSEEVDRRFF